MFFSNSGKMEILSLYEHVLGVCCIILWLTKTLFTLLPGFFKGCSLSVLSRSRRHELPDIFHVLHKIKEGKM